MQDLIARLDKIGVFLQEMVNGSGIYLERLGVINDPEQAANLHNPDNCVVLQTRIDRGAFFQPHYLEFTKHLICARGKVRVFKKAFWGFRSKTLQEGQHIRIKPGTAHYAKACRDSIIIAVLTKPSIAKERPPVDRLDSEKDFRI